MRCLIDIAIVLLAVLTSTTQVVWAQALSSIVDEQTGIKVALPLSKLIAKERTQRGTNWKFSVSNLDIDTLNFGNSRTLKDIYDKLRSIDGRKVSSSSFTYSEFFMSGADRDGTFFFVGGEKHANEVRALSIVYANEKAAPLVSKIIRSFKPFPDRNGGQTAWGGREAPALRADSTEESGVAPEQTMKTPNSAGASPHRKALAALEMGRTDDALALIERALSKAPANADLLETRARIFEIQGRTAEALMDYRTALVLKPNLQESRAGIARLIERAR